MRPITICILRLTTPLLVPLCRTQVEDHHHNLLPPLAVAATCLDLPFHLRHTVQVCKLIALPAPGATVLAGMLEQALSGTSCVNSVGGTGLPALVCDAAACATVAVEVVASRRGMTELRRPGFVTVPLEAFVRLG